MGNEQVYVLLVQHMGQSVGGGLQVQQAPLLGFRHPGGIIAVTVEDDALVVRNGLADQLMEGGLEVLYALQSIGEFLQLLRHNGVEHRVGAGDGLGGAQHPELKLVAGKGEGAGPVPVRGISLELGQGMDADAHDFLFLAVVRRFLFDGLQDLAQVGAQEHGHNGGRGLVGTQPMIVAGGGNGDPQQILVFIHSLDDGAEEQQELGVFIGGLPGLQEVHAGVRGDGPVVVLTAAVDPVEGLLVEQTHQAMALGHLAHHLHSQLVVVRGNVGGGEDGGHFMLGRGHLVVLGLGQDSQLPQLLIQLLHKGGDSGLDGTEVMVIQLLALGGLGTEEGPAGVDQVLAPVEIRLVDEEVLLLRANGGLDGGHILVAEELQHPQSLAVDGLHGPQQSRLLVQGLSAVGAEHRGDAQDSVLDKGIGGRVPGGVAPGLKGSPQAAGGEGTGIRLALDQLLAGELHNDLAPGLGGNEGIVLLGGNAGHGLEPVGIVGSALFHSPVLHGVGHHGGYIHIQVLAQLDGPLQGLIGLLGKPGFHCSVIEYHGRKDIGYHKNFPFSKKIGMKKSDREPSEKLLNDILVALFKWEPPEGLPPCFARNIPPGMQFVNR